MPELTENGILTARSTPEDRRKAALTLAEVAMQLARERDLVVVLAMVGVV